MGDRFALFVRIKTLLASSAPRIDAFPEHTEKSEWERHRCDLRLGRELVVSVPYRNHDAGAELEDIGALDIDAQRRSFAQPGFHFLRDSTPTGSFGDLRPNVNEDRKSKSSGTGRARLSVSSYAIYFFPVRRL